MVKGKREQKIRSEKEITQTNRARFGKLLLHYRNHESEENVMELRKIKADYEEAIQTEMLINRQQQQEITAVGMLSVMEKARDTVINRNWPEGVPAMPKDKPRFWYEDTDQRVHELVKKKKYLMRKWLDFQRTAPSSRIMEICLRDMKPTQRNLRTLLKSKRDQYWNNNSKLLEEAYIRKDMKLYYQRVKMMHGKSLIRESINGNQLLLGQQIRQLDKKTLTRNDEETAARWVQHFAMLFNQPDDVGPTIEENLPQQRQQQGSIRTGPFSELELTQAIKCMQNDKAAGPDGFAVEIDKYASGPEAKQHYYYYITLYFQRERYLMC